MDAKDPSAPLDLADLEAISVLGRGAKGVVFLVRRRSTGEKLALKAISRSSLHNKGSKKQHSSTADAYRRVHFERDTLAQLRHPLLPSLRGSLLTDLVVAFALPLCSGHDLHSLRLSQSEKMFSDDVIRFYAAELVLALEYLHGLGIAYRDLKPENILIQDSGHIMIVDFDLSTKLPFRSQSPPPRRLQSPLENRDGHAKTRWRLLALGRCGFGGLSRAVSPAESRHDSAESGDPTPPEEPAKSNSFVGTQDYVAPEIVSGEGHDFAADWWSLGVLLYEMLYGRLPFRGADRKETFYRILTMSPDLAGDPTPLRDLIGRLLEKSPERRISGEEVKRHEFFRGVVWESVLEIARPPFIPSRWRGEVEAEGGSAIDIEGFVENVFGGGGAKKRNPEAEEKRSGGVWVGTLTANGGHDHNAANFSMF